MTVEQDGLHLSVQLYRYNLILLTTKYMKHKSTNYIRAEDDNFHTAVCIKQNR